ncbi:MAG TPA: LuxR C-terminal-related transcriptional regulator [Ktedonobacteraceae bacterium]|nr:LuxR C-terminal-related transcriptional regulator [Ktedonobacteraceae bacterium]
MSISDLSSYGLVSTKLSVPVLPATLLSRPRLVRELGEALSHKLTLLSAPAGSGKTLLLRQWIMHIPLSVGWLSLTKDDNDPMRFWSYIVAACRTVQDTVGRHMMAQFQSPEPPPLEALLPLLINDLASVPQPFVLVLDDYHVITESAIHHTLRSFLDQLPPSLHLVLASRTDPPLALARRRVRQELVELRMADIRFTQQEVTEWFTHLLHLPLSPTQIALLMDRTEGWAAALHLAALSLHGSSDLSQTLADFTGSHRHVIDYLLEEVLAHQPEEVHSFLLSTAFLDRLTASLCNALTGRSDGQAMLEALERAGLFVQPLDEQRRWYRYHPLFAEVLRVCAVQERGNEQRVVLSRQASGWYEQHGLLLEAVEMALSAADYETAIRIGFSVVPPLLLTGQHATVARWIEQVPHTQRSSHPLLSLALAWTRLLLGQRTLALEPLREAEQSFASRQDHQGLGQVAAARALLARLARDGKDALRWGQVALALLPEEVQAQRCFSVIALGYGYLLQGEVTLARQQLPEARLLSEQLESKSGLLGSTLLEGEILALQGKLPQAAMCYQQVTDAGETWMPLAIEASLALGALLLEWNELDGAAVQLERALRLSQQYEETSLVARSVLLQARLLQAKASSDQAEEAFWRAVILARQSKHPQLQASAHAYQVRWWLVQGNLEAARQFQDTYGLTSEEAPRYEHEEVALTLVRVLLAQGETAGARRLLERWQAFATMQGRTQSLVEMFMLLARAADMQGQLAEAVSLLHQALVLASQGRYCQIFVLEGPALSHLLRLLEPRVRGKASAPYLEHVLAAMPARQPISSSPSSPSTHIPLLSPLTPREYKVLRLLAAGLSTREIASELVVSLNTIKTQVQSLYRKLDANSREEALTLARAFQLL